MRITRLIYAITNHLNSEYRKAKIRARLLTTVIGNDTFSRLTLQDKIISLAKLIACFERDFGVAPRRLLRMLIQLNRQFNSELSKNRLAIYSGLSNK